MKQIRQKVVWLSILLIISIISLGIGVTNIDIHALFTGDADAWNLLFISRLPRLFSVLVTGAGLSVAGLIMQTITNNKFVSPSTAGTMEWCRLGVLLAIVVFGSSSSIIQIIVAFTVSLGGTLLFMKILSKIRYKDTIMVPLLGMMLGNIVSAITMFFAYQLDIIQNMSSWLLGNFALIIKGNYEMLYLGIPFLVIAVMYAKRFTIVGMGESFSKNLGIHYERIVFIGLAIVSIVTATIVVSVGSIAFVGLLVPNIISMYKGDHLESTLFDTAIVGAIFVLGCDILSRTIIAPYEIPISVIISVVGSVIFLGIIFKRRQQYA